MAVWPTWGFYHKVLDSFYFKGEKEMLSITGKDGLLEHVINFMALTGWKRVATSPTCIIYANPPTAFLIQTGALSIDELDTD